jgi:hypothetical protein
MSAFFTAKGNPKQIFHPVHTAAAANASRMTTRVMIETAASTKDFNSAIPGAAL